MIRVKKLFSFPFLILLVISVALWLVGKLSHNYTTQVEIPIEIVTDYDSQMWVDNSEKRVRSIVTADGRDILLYKMKLAPRVTIPLSMLTIDHRSDASDIYLYQVKESSLEKAIMQAQNKLVVNMIVDTLQTLRVSFLDTKRVPVMANIDVNCIEGYMQVGSTKLSIDSIDIKAPWAILDTLNSIITERIVLGDLHGTANGTVELRIPRDVIAKADHKVSYEIRTEPYSEKVLTIPITVQGLPSARTLPALAKVRMRVPMALYWSTTMPVATIDPSINSRSGFYPINIADVASGIVVTNVEPMMAEYFIEE